MATSPTRRPGARPASRPGRRPPARRRHPARNASRRVSASGRSVASDSCGLGPAADPSRSAVRSASCAACLPIVGVSAASARSLPATAGRLRRMAAGSTSRPSISSRAICREAQVSRQTSGRATHSAFQLRAVAFRGADHALEQDGRGRTGEPGQGVEVLAALGVALVRHRDAADDVRVGRLAQLADLWALQLVDLEADAGEAARDHREHGSDLRHPVPSRQPRDARVGQAERCRSGPAPPAPPVRGPRACRRRRRAGRRTSGGPRRASGPGADASRRPTRPAFQPKVTGAPGCPWVRPAWTVSRYRSARSSSRSSRRAGRARRCRRPPVPRAMSTCR